MVLDCIDSLSLPSFLLRLARGLILTHVWKLQDVLVLLVLNGIWWERNNNKVYISYIILPKILSIYLVYAFDLNELNQS